MHTGAHVSFILGGRGFGDPCPSLGEIEMPKRTFDGAAL